MENQTTREVDHDLKVAAPNPTTMTSLSTMPSDSTLFSPSTMTVDPASDPRIPLKPNSLSRIPPELKQKIFFLAGGSAEAVAAFRPDVSTYQDALKAYYALTRFNIPFQFYLKDTPLSQTSLNSLRKLRVHLNHTIPLWCSSIPRPGGRTAYSVFRLPEPTRIPKEHHEAFWTLEQFINLNIIDVEIRLTQNRVFYDVDTAQVLDPDMEPIKGTFQGRILKNLRFPKLVQYSEIFIKLAETIKLAEEQGASLKLKKLAIEITWDEEKNFESVMCDLNKRFGINAKLKTVSTSDTAVFFWEAEEGETIKWMP